MKHTFLVLACGAISGAAVHVGWFQLHRPAPAESLETQLAWMKTDLGLAPEQFVTIKELHERLEPRLMQLAAEVERLRGEFAAFERERLEDGEVDFVEVARAAAARRNIDRECDASTHQLVAATTSVMTPAQRKRYLEILAPALENSTARSTY